MHVHINHMFCTRPCWDDVEKTYWSRYLVAVERNAMSKGYDDSEKDYFDLTEEHSYFDESEYEKLKTFESCKHLSDEEIKKWATRAFRKFKPEIIEWLNENVKERTDGEHPKGWCIGTDEYLYRDTMSISIFFYRRKDALAFIERWSVYKNPTTYFDYFHDIRKELNLETNKLEKVESFK